MQTHSDMEEGHVLLKKLDQFIRRYYKFRIIRGILITLALVAGLFLLMTILEYYLYFGSRIRASLLILYLGLIGWVSFSLILMPLMKLFRIGKVLSYEDASAIVSEHFKNIQDKLLNTLQLIQRSSEDSNQVDLLKASIEQRSRSLSVIPFAGAINFRKNYRWLRIALVPVSFILAILILSPGIISEPADRYMKFREEFLRPLPYSIRLMNEKLEVLQQEDLEIGVMISGEEVPEELFISVNGALSSFTKNKKGLFSYIFRSVQSDFEFELVTGDYESAPYRVKVLPKPSLISFTVQIACPSYLGLNDELLTNTGDITVPEGSRLTWTIVTRDADQLLFLLGNETLESSGNGDNGKFSFTKQLASSVTYMIVPKNRYSVPQDTVSYRITVLPDGYPGIRLLKKSDSVSNGYRMYMGEIKDDHGFTDLKFCYQIFFEQGSRKDTTGYINIPIDEGVSEQIFTFGVNAEDLRVNGARRVEYFFEVADNDGINGPKHTKSEIIEWYLPTPDEIESKIEKEDQVNRMSLENSLKSSEGISRELEKMDRTLTEKANLDWQDKKAIEDIMKKTGQIIDTLEEIRNRNENNLEESRKFLETSERILDKQRQINELMDKVLTEEVKEMLKEMQDLLKQIDKNKLSSMLEEMKDKTEQLENELERNLSLLKQLELERRIDKTSRDLDKLAEEQQKLAEKSDENRHSDMELEKEQEQLNSKYEKVKEELNTIDSLAKSDSDDLDIEQTKDLQEEIKSLMQQGSNDLKNNKTREASGKQRKAAGQMKKLSEQLQEMMLNSENEEMEEDLGDLRMILENLLRLSFTQEELLYESRRISRSDPAYQQLLLLQIEIKEKCKTVEDSLNVIARKQIFIQPVISRELRMINEHISMAIDALDNRNMQNVTANQQYTMTSMNNLAILLDEAIRQMENQMNSNMMSKGKNACKNPQQKGGQAKMKGMREMQQQIGRQLEKLKKEMSNSASGKPENKTGKGEFSREVARLAAMQEALRNEMEKYQERLLEEGERGAGELSKTIEEMERNERDLLNKTINQETLNRQQRIETRMLDSERAEQTREQEERRESEEAKSAIKRNPDAILPYKKDITGGKEMIRLEVLPVKQYYKGLINHYMMEIAK